MIGEFLKAFLGNPWNAGALETARHDFRRNRLTEGQFRSYLHQLGFTEYGIDREVNDQLGMMAAPTCYPGVCNTKEGR